MNFINQKTNKKKALNFALTLEAGIQKMQNQTIFELYADDNKSKYSSNPKDILKSEKNEELYIK